MSKIHRICLSLAWALGTLAILSLPIRAKPAQEASVNTKEGQAFDAQNLMQKRTQDIQILLRFAQTAARAPHQQFEQALMLEDSIDLLGQYRAVEAAPFLVEHITLRSGSHFRTEYIPFGDFPCVGALIKIGNPTLPAILQRLNPPTFVVNQNPLDERDLHLFAYIIRQIDGDEVGLYRLQLAAKDAKGDYKVNLLDLIDFYKRKESELDIKKAILMPEPLPEKPPAKQDKPK